MFQSHAHAQSDMTQAVLLLCCVGLAGALLGQAAQDFEYPLPECLTICHRDDPDLNACIKNSVEHLRPYLSQGSASAWPSVPFKPTAIRPATLHANLVRSRCIRTLRNNFDQLIVNTLTTHIFGGLALMPMYEEFLTEMNGIPELGIPPCEPLRLPEVVINQGRGAVNVQSTYNDVLVRGASEFELRSVRLDLDKHRMRIKVKIPALRLTSMYTMEGRILMLPIQGTGVADGNYTDIETTCTVQGETVKRGELTYFNVIEFDVIFNIGHAQVLLDDLFNGNKEMGDSMNAFLNENWRNVAQEIRPMMERTIGDMFRTFSNKIFHKYPLEQLLPP